MNKELEILCLFEGVKKDDTTSLILAEQGEAAKTIAMFEDLVVKILY